MSPRRYNNLNDLMHELDSEGFDSEELDILGDEDLETLKIPPIQHEPSLPSKPKRPRKPRSKKTS